MSVRGEVALHRRPLAKTLKWLSGIDFLVPWHQTSAHNEHFFHCLGHGDSEQSRLRAASRECELTCAMPIICFHYYDSISGCLFDNQTPIVVSLPLQPV